MFFRHPRAGFSGHGIEHGFDNLQRSFHQANFFGALGQAHILHQRCRVDDGGFRKGLFYPFDGGVGD